jgi:hypothetical protein
LFLFLCVCSEPLPRHPSPWNLTTFLHICILKMEVPSSYETSENIYRQRILFAAGFAYSPTLKKERVHFFETSVHFYQTTRRHISEDSTLHSQNFISLHRLGTSGLSLNFSPAFLKKNCG